MICRLHARNETRKKVLYETSSQILPTRRLLPPIKDNRNCSRRQPTIKIRNQKATKRFSTIFQKVSSRHQLLYISIKPKIANTVQICIINEYPTQWRVRRRWVRTIGDLLQAAISYPPQSQEGKFLEMDDTSFISDMTHITAKITTPANQTPPNLSPAT